MAESCTTSSCGEELMVGCVGEVCIPGGIVVMAREEAMVEGVAKGKGDAQSCDIGVATWAVRVVSSRGSEPIRIVGGEGMVEEELKARAEETTRGDREYPLKEGDGV